MDAGDFVLPVDKPEGPTSHDVVGMARKALGTRRVGHTGTLDPFASGVLVLCIGRATRLAEYLTGLDKRYVAQARLGVATDTLDREGEVVAEDDGWSKLSTEAVETALRSFVGEVQQVPPQFSAKKVDGEAMHRKARRGERVELPPVSITVHGMELIDFDAPDVTFGVRCSTGTYVRALARDLGHALGVGAHLTALRRTSVGPFELDDALAVDDLERVEAVQARRVSPLRALGHLPTVEVEESEAVRIRHGQRVRIETTVAPGDVGSEPAAGLVAVAPGSDLVAVAQGADLVAVARLEDGVVKPTKVFPA